MAKKMILFFTALLLLCAFASASTINDYKVTASVPLGQNVTATGFYLDSNGLNSGRLCSFYLTDVNGVLINRPDDQFTDSLGNFAMFFPINEPQFKRTFDYKIKTVCGDANSTADFSVAQRESIAQPASQEFEFLTNPQQTDTAFIWGAIIVIFVIVIFVGLYFYRQARS